MCWHSMTGGVLCHRGSLQCIPLAFQREQWAELTEAIQRQTEAKKVPGTGGSGAPLPPSGHSVGS